MLSIPEPFKERYCPLVDDPEAFLASLSRQLPKSFRVNSLKASADDVRARLAALGVKATQMPWYEDAFLSDSLDIGGTLLHFTGMIYMQELVSMLPPVIARKELEDAGLVLDSCAAPGSKTTQIAAIMKNLRTLVANDLDYSRIRALKFNLEKTGVLNTVMTNYDLQHFPKNQFDVVFLDAPCSSEGTVRKNDRLFQSWSLRSTPSYSGNQKVLLLKAFDLLRPGGLLVYSTCTFAPEENELVIDHLLKNKEEAALEKISIDGMKTSPAVMEWMGQSFDGRIKDCARIWPHENDTGGFFLAKVRK